MHDKVPYLDLPAQIRPLRKKLMPPSPATSTPAPFVSDQMSSSLKRFRQVLRRGTRRRLQQRTSALHVALLLLNIKQGRRDHHHAAHSWRRAGAISYVNATPVYVDIDDATFNLDPAKIEAAITPRTKAIMPVHLYGHPFDLDPILAIAKTQPAGR